MSNDDYRQERTDAAYQAALDAMAEFDGGVQLPVVYGFDRHRDVSGDETDAN